MDDFEICLATKKDLSILNILYAEMDNKPLMSEEKILEIWHQIQQVPDYYIYLAYLEERAIGTFSLVAESPAPYPDRDRSRDVKQRD